MSLGSAVKQVWERVTGAPGIAAAAEGERKTTATPLGLSGVFAPLRASGTQASLPKLQAHPWLMENYLLNYVGRTLFPFGRAASAHLSRKGYWASFC